MPSDFKEYVGFKTSWDTRRKQPWSLEPPVASVLEKRITTMNSGTYNNDGWTTARKRRPARAGSSPARSEASSVSTASNRTRSSNRTAASRASTRHARNFGNLRLTVGQTIQGRVTGIQDFGAFLDVGAAKDGLLHASEADPHGGKPANLHSLFAVGDLLQVMVKAVGDDNKVSLTRRSAASSKGTTHNRTIRAPSAAALAAMAAAEVAAEDRERRRAEAVRLRAQAEAERRAQVEAAAAAAAAKRAREREAAEASMAKVYAAGVEWEGLTASVQRGEPVERPRTEEPMTVLATKALKGRTLVLYKMPWRRIDC